MTTVKYTVDSRRELTVEGFSVTVLNIALECDVNSTPWCLRPEDHEWYLKQKEQQPVPVNQLQPQEDRAPPAAP